MSRYYQEEHESTYSALLEKGFEQWNDMFEPGRWTFEHFQNRPFLEHVITEYLPQGTTGLHLLEYGCGTGPAACFMASRGFNVDAFDLVPEAIGMARFMAQDKKLVVDFQVADICSSDVLPFDKKYDLIVDSYCLQSIVLDQDRERLFAVVRDRLKADGLYVISTALQNPTRKIDEDHFFDEETDILYRQQPQGFESEDTVQINGRKMIPHRRHRTSEGIETELTNAGFLVCENGSVSEGDIVCKLRTQSHQSPDS